MEKHFPWTFNVGTQSIPSPITLINVFELPKDTDEHAFVEWWKRSTEAMKGTPGFIDAVLHRSLSDDARFRFINVAHWQTVESLQEALAKGWSVVQEKPAGNWNPEVYTIEVQY